MRVGGEKLIIMLTNSVLGLAASFEPGLEMTRKKNNSCSLGLQLSILVIIASQCVRLTHCAVLTGKLVERMIMKLIKLARYVLSYNTQVHTHLLYAHTYTHSGEPPVFTSQPEDTFVFEVDAEGNPVTLRFDCPVQGDPKPTISW